MLSLLSLFMSPLSPAYTIIVEMENQQQAEPLSGHQPTRNVPEHQPASTAPKRQHTTSASAEHLADGQHKKRRSQDDIDEGGLVCRYGIYKSLNEVQVICSYLRCSFYVGSSRRVVHFDTTVVANWSTFCV